MTIYTYWNTDDKKLSSMASTQLSEEQKGSRIEIGLDDGHDIFSSANPHVEWQLNGASDDVELSGIGAADIWDGGEPGTTVEKVDRIAAVLRTMCDIPLP